MEKELINNIKKKLQLSSTISFILMVVFSLFLVASILIMFLYNNFIEAIKDDVSKEFLDVVKTEGVLPVLLLYLLIFILIVPFLIESITQVVSTNKLVRTVEKVDKALVLSLIKNSFIFLAFSLAFPIGVIIAYLTLNVGNIWFLFVPLILTVPLYVLADYLKLSSFFKAFNYLKNNIKAR